MKALFNPTSNIQSVENERPLGVFGGWDRLRRPPFGTGGRALVMLFPWHVLTLEVVCVCDVYSAVVVVALLFGGETQGMIWNFG